MRLIALAAVALACAAAPASAGTADTVKPKLWVARYCSPSGDLCYGIFRSGGIVFQLNTVEKYFDRHSICVRSPRGRRTCRAVTVTRQGRLWGSTKRWPRNFGDRRPGVYRVTWLQSGRPLGPTLRFRHR